MAEVLKPDAWDRFRKEQMINGGTPHLQKTQRVSFNPEDQDHLRAAMQIIEYRRAALNFTVVPPYKDVRQMVLEVLARRYLSEGFAVL